MILTPRLTAKILARQKRLHIFGRDKDTCPYSVGHSYAVQSKAGKKQTCRVKVTKIEEGALSKVTDQQAVLNGFEDAEGMWEDWRLRFDPDLFCKPCPVWIVHFELDTEAQPRLLHRDSSHGYTTSRFQSLGGQLDPGEAVPDVIQREFSALANLKDKQRRHESAEAKAERYRKALDQLRGDFAEEGLDMRSELRVLERRLQEKLRKKAA